jgi:transposase-like protein
MEPGANATEVARKAGVDRSLLYRWRQQLATSRDFPAFVPVTVAPTAAELEPTSPRAMITISFGANVRVTIEGSPDEATLATSARWWGAIIGPNERNSPKDDRISEPRSGPFCARFSAQNMLCFAL